jgi:hypothetical protein
MRNNCTGQILNYAINIGYEKYLSWKIMKLATNRYKKYLSFKKIFGCTINESKKYPRWKIYLKRSDRYKVYNN